MRSSILYPLFSSTRVELSPRLGDNPPDVDLFHALRTLQAARAAAEDPAWAAPEIGADDDMPRWIAPRPEPPGVARPIQVQRRDALRGRQMQRPAVYPQRQRRSPQQRRELPDGRSPRQRERPRAHPPGDILDQRFFARPTRDDEPHT